MQQITNYKENICHFSNKKIYNVYNIISYHILLHITTYLIINIPINFVLFY